MRRAELINALASDSPAHKRRSSVADLALLSMSASFLDNTDKNLLTPEPPQQPAERMSSAAPRYHNFLFIAWFLRFRNPELKL
jgi:hypothetical protein